MRKKKVYQAKKGAPFSPKKVQEYGDELERISRENKNRLESKTVVEKATDESSPLHNYFEWNDSKAGHGYRLWQARQLINHIEVIVRHKGDERPVPAFISLVVHNGEDKPRRKYISSEIVAKDENLRKQAIETALRELLIWQIKYKELKELSEIFSIAEKM